MFKHPFSTMSNVVFTTYDCSVYLSVFDEKNNELFNVKDYETNIFDILKEQKYFIENYITSSEYYNCDNLAIHFVFYNYRLEDVKKSDNTFSLILNCENLIANESEHGFGLNRYLHREFLNHKNKHERN